MTPTFVMLVITLGADDKIIAAASVFQSQALCKAATPVVSDELNLDPDVGEFRVYCLPIEKVSAVLKKARCVQESSDDGVHLYTCQGIAKSKDAEL